MKEAAVCCRVCINASEMMLGVLPAAAEGKKNLILWKKKCIWALVTEVVKVLIANSGLTPG